MKKSYFIIACLFINILFGFSQTDKSYKNDLSKSKEKKLITPKKISFNVNAESSESAKTNTVKTNANRASWNLLHSFETHEISHQAVVSDGSYIYTTQWNGSGVFHKYSLDGTYIDAFTISTASAIRDLTSDGTYFYGSAASMTMFKMNFATASFVSHINATCAGITGIRHCTYDSNLDGGNGGFWIGNWNELGAISMSGDQIYANIPGNTDCYGSALDNWSDPSNPRLLLFQQGGSGVEIHGFDINSQTYMGLIHDADEVPGFDPANGIAGGLYSFEYSGKLILLGNIQQNENIVFIYDIADIAPADAPTAASNLVVVPAANGVMEANVSWKNPETTVMGDNLTELTSVSLFIDNESSASYENTSPVIGGDENVNDLDLMGFSAGMHTFKVIATNSAGDGIPASVNAWIGEDVPSEPSNVVLVEIPEMIANLTWEAPTTGLHGGYFSGNNVVYDVIRYPGEILVSENQVELSFEETISSVGNYYYTVIAKNNSGTGGITNSNSELFGNFLLYEDFEIVFPPENWEVISNNATWASANTTVHPAGIPPYSGNKLAFFNSYFVQNGSASLITPEVDIDGKYVLLSFWMYHDIGYSSNTDNIQLKISTDGSTWNNLGSQILRYSPIVGWKNYEYIMLGTSETTKFNFFATSDWGNDIHIDFVTLVEITGCVKPTSLSVLNITHESAIITWTENAEAETWEIQWGEQGFTLGDGTIKQANSNPDTITSLVPYTVYDFYVRAVCDTSFSEWVGPQFFTTLGCDSTEQCGYVFTLGDSYGDGWNGAQINIKENNVLVNSITFTSGSSLVVNMPICHDVSVSLEWVAGSYDFECAMTLTDPYGIDLFSFNYNNAPAVGEFFSFTSNCTPPSCLWPSSLNATNITTESAVLGWTPGSTETSWNIEWGLAGFTQGTGTSLSVNNNSYNLLGLNEGTKYAFYVQADCDTDGLSLWRGPYLFTTSCNIIVDFPWTDDFENDINCYVLAGNPNVATWYWDENSFNPHSGLSKVAIDYDAALMNQNQWLVSQEFDFTAISNPVIKFWWSMSYYWAVSPYNNYDVFLKISTDNGSTWTQIWTEPTDNFADFTWQQDIINLSAYVGESSVRFAFNYVGNDGASFYLDDIVIDGITGINNISQTLANVYPNPTNGILYFNIVENANIEVYNMLGQKLDHFKNVNSVDLSNYEQGNYIIKIITSDNIITSKINLIK